MNKLRFIIFHFTLLASFSFGQQGSFLRHQFGLNASEFVLLFENQHNSSVLNYRYKLDSNYSARLGLDFKQVKSDDGNLNFSIRTGFDRTIHHFEKWEVYTALDFFFQKQIYEVDKRSTRKVGGQFALGILFRPSKNFSISTEPNFTWLFVKFHDPTSFSNKIIEWQERQLGNIGQLLVNVHF